MALKDYAPARLALKGADAVIDKARGLTRTNNPPKPYKEKTPRDITDRALKTPSDADARASDREMSRDTVYHRRPTQVGGALSKGRYTRRPVAGRR